MKISTFMIGWVLALISPVHLAAESVQPAFDSGIVTAETPGHAVRIDIDVTKVEMVYLVATDGEDGNGCDFANWAEPHFVAPEGEVRLIDLQPQTVWMAFGTLGDTRNAEGAPMKINGEAVDYGLGAHANSILVYKVPPGATRFKVRAGLDAQGVDEGCGATVRFRVYTKRPDGVLIQSLMRKQEAVPAEAGPVKPSVAASSDHFNVKEGFAVELLYSVPREEQGSWVAVCTDDRGRLITVSQYGKFFRVTPPSGGSPIQIESLDIEIPGAQGLLYAFDSLYVMCNDYKARTGGFYRVLDDDGDDQFDQVQLLRKLDGWGEHGPHAILPSPDGKTLTVVLGNGTKLTDIVSSRVPLLGTDQEAVGGYVCRVDPDGQNWELITCGFRNPYDAAYNRIGELFTYDADMEWDHGTPWYRPTRVCHVVSGAHFGWRANYDKMPPHWADNWPPVVDIGVGSPTGVAFGYGSAFPPAYRDALYISDWSFGRVYAVHLTPKGATYTGKAEAFLTGSPLPVTDLVIRPKDGAMYFTTGGRGVQSGLYRLSYVGGPSLTMPGEIPVDRKLHDLRQRLEALHHNTPPDAVAYAWKHLGHEDRFIRQAARTVLEHRPVVEWRDRALSEREPLASLTALLALARFGEAGDQLAVINALLRDQPGQLKRALLLDWLRVAQVASERGTDGNAKVARIFADRLLPLFPAPTMEVTTDIARLLMKNSDERIIQAVVQRMADAPTQEEKILHARLLAEADTGWNDVLRDRFVSQFVDLAIHAHGGRWLVQAMGEFQELIEQKLAPQQRDALREQIPQGRRRNTPTAEAVDRPYVKNWTVDEIVAIAQDGLSGGDVVNGQLMFAAARCVACHQVRGEGSSVGPDLTGVGRRFSVRDIAEAIVEPSRVVSDQYSNTIYTLSNGRQIIGRVANLGGDVIQVLTNPLTPNDFVNVQVDQIVAQVESPISPMMSGLVNSLNQSEMRDLLAYLLEVGAQ